MIDYKEIRINIEPCNETITDLLAAFLADIGYESFVPDETGLTAYIQTSLYSAGQLEEMLKEFPMEAKLSYSVAEIEGKDWNEEWEKNYFQPIVIGEDCVIHSSFHKDVPKAKYDIVIDPKMAFGTGHHATTELMLSYLLAMPLAGKHVIDMGTGTGILAILCSMLGADYVKAIEIDPGAADNAREHLSMNNVENVEVITGDAHALPAEAYADLLLANINRNIILADFDAYCDALKPGGELLLSGFYEQDVPLIEARAAMRGYEIAEKRVIDNWTALKLLPKK